MTAGTTEAAERSVLEVRRTAVGETRTVAEAQPELDAGQVRLHIDRFALTANNITYAVFGDVLAYWEFFPTELPWGRVPAMGWAEVTESNVDGIDVGSRYYGWYPMATSTVITATPTADGFRDDGEHRAPHAPVYRAYVDRRRDGLYDDAPDGEDRHVLLRGLFLTGYLAEEFFADGGGADGAAPYFGAEQVVVMSASSKTAIGFAQRAKRRGTARVVGVTSPGNVAFVGDLGYYDDVVTYDDVGTIDQVDSVSIDMAGNPTVLAAVHERFGDRLRYSMTVGRSHHDAPPPAAAAALAGPQPQLFFAPTEVGRRRQEWSREEYERRTAEALHEFVDGSRSWMRVEHRSGTDGMTTAWADVHDGEIAPDVGIVVLPQGD